MNIPWFYSIRDYIKFKKKKNLNNCNILELAKKIEKIRNDVYTLKKGRDAVKKDILQS